MGGVPPKQLYENSTIEELTCQAINLEESAASGRTHLSTPKPVAPKKDLIASECDAALATLAQLESEAHINHYNAFNQSILDDTKEAVSDSQDAFLSVKLRTELSKLQNDIEARNYGWNVRPVRKKLIILQSGEKFLAHRH